MKYTIDNYEEYAIDFLDGTMSQEEIGEFRKFLELHPKIKSELYDLEVISLPKYKVTFPLKKKLFQEEKQAKKSTLFIYLRNIAAAIILLLMATSLWNSRFSNNNVAVNQLHQEENVNFSISDSTIEINNEAKKQSDLVTTASNNSEENNIVKSEPVRKKIHGLIESEAKVIDQPVFAADVTEEEDVARLALRDVELPEKPSRQEVRVVSVLQPIQTTSIRPEFSGQIIPALPEEMILISSEVVDKEGPTKIGKLLAKINLIPEGILEEFSANNLRESLLPEYYSDLK